MPSSIKTVSGYKLVYNAWQKIAGVWVRTPDIFTKIDDSWKRVHADLGVFDFSATITGTVYNYSLYNALVTAGWDGIAVVHATVTIASGAVVASTSTGAYAFSSGASYPAGSLLVLINNGKIIGKGGQGGAGSVALASPSAGVFGGPALVIGLTCTLYNYGTIAGGGGGGAGGRTMVMDDVGGISSKAQGGGGGGGIGAGVGGASTGGVAGSTGTFVAAGNGGVGQSFNYFYYYDNATHASQGETGGVGGAYASTGGIGYGGYVSPAYSGNDYKSGVSAAGGVGGAALSGNSFITYAVLGTINGATL